MVGAVVAAPVVRGFFSRDCTIVTTHADETIAAARHIEHPWDEKALDWPLTRSSVVVEVGGYKGRWAYQIAERYGSKLYVFEPQGWAYNVCREVLGDRATVLGYGLGVADGFLPMSSYETDGCTFVGGDGPLCEVREIGGVVKRLRLRHIDLMLINIEGGEYQLIPHMLGQGIVPERLMVQMHTFAGDSDALRAVLAERYRLLWDYGDVLTAWER